MNTMIIIMHFLANTIAMLMKVYISVQTGILDSGPAYQQRFQFIRKPPSRRQSFHLPLQDNLTRHLTSQNHRERQVVIKIIFLAKKNGILLLIYMMTTI